MSLLSGKARLPSNEYRTVQDLLCLNVLRNTEDEPWVCAILAGEKMDSARLSTEVRQIAKRLTGYDRIAIAMEPSFELIIMLCACVFSGVTYVPIEPSLPSERIAYILNDSEVPVIIVDDRFVEGNANIPVIKFNEIFSKLPTTEDQTKRREIHDEETFCLMYTSGSTGRPKGVKIPHRAVINRLEWQWSRFPFDDDEICCLKTSISFVDSICELFAPLFRRIPIVVVTKSSLRDLDRLISILIEQKVSRLLLVPSFLAVLLSYLSGEKRTFPAMKMIISSGEQLSVHLVEQFFAMQPMFSSQCVLLNLYGSTEVMADVTYEVFDSMASFRTQHLFHGRVSIGYPIDNTTVDIIHMNDEGIGEIVITGRSVANGYHRHSTNQIEIVEERFGRSVDHQFSYRTGDLARIWNNRLVYYGRTDQQVSWLYSMFGNVVSLFAGENQRESIRPLRD